jgi:hypothetical protein
MGEYGTYEGTEIKIGTCEDMYYLRADQIHLVRSATLDHVDALRFRFPFPDEDDVKPGEFDKYNKGFRVWGIEPPSDGHVLHYDVQFKDTGNVGVLVMLPCPYSTKGKDSGIKYGYNGYRGPAQVVQQRAWNGVWVTVMQCGVCSGLWRLETVEDALPVCEALISQGDQRERDDKGGGKGWYEMALRIRRGYETPVK